MTILAVDPSSRATGYAVLEPEGHEIIDCGVWGGWKEDAYVRVEKMCALFESAIDEWSPTDIVVEITSGHVAARHRGEGQGLALYGMAVGALLACATIAVRPIEAGGEHLARVHRVYENVWTGGLPKRNYKGQTPINRHDQIVTEFKLPMRTPHDVTDAVGLGMWWWANRKMLEKTA